MRTTVQPLAIQALAALSIGVLALLPAVSAEAQQATSPATTATAPYEARIPSKVGRYIMRLIAKYDENNDGVLQKEEWAKMAGSPQRIDLDLDGVITVKEMTYRVTDFGLNFGRPQPAATETAEDTADTREGYVLFRPISAPVAPPTASSEGEESDVVAAEDLEVAVEELLEEGTPWKRKYTHSREELVGLPAWFLVVDVDGDAQVTLLEFAPNLSSGRLAQFGAFDRNGDGIISSQEAGGR